MCAEFDPITQLIASIAEPGISIGHRFIAQGDESALLAIEAQYFQKAKLQVRRQSGAARAAARELLSGLGLDGVAIARKPSGAPIWPAGIVGSLAHEERLAMAAVAQATEFAGIGIDIEPADNLPAELVDVVATPAERSRYDQNFLQTRALFATKEAVYKAVHPIDNIFLEFHDIEVDFKKQIARVSYGRLISVKVNASSYVVALAFLKSGPSNTQRRR